MGWLDDITEALPFSGLLDFGARWVTLKSGTRVKLDADGRIVAGLPSKYHGIHVGDFGRVSKEERELLGIDCDELAACHTCVKTFATKDQAAIDVEACRADVDARIAALFKDAREGRVDPKAQPADVPF